MKRNIQDTLLTRELSHCPSARFKREIKSSRSLTEGLRLSHVLEEHRGCVNTVTWHPSGRELISSGDDLQLCLWDASDWHLRGSYRTGHSGNVFCVQYVPFQENSFVTAAADGDVRLTDLIQQADHSVRPRVELLSETLGDMTLKIEFLPLAPLSFLTTHQDGTIRLMDLRNARRTGTAGDAPEQLVVELREQQFYSLCFDPCNPHTFAASTSNHFVRLYDLRMTGRPYDRDATTGGCVKLWTDPALLPNGNELAPNALRRPSRRHVTDVRFSASGELLCNYLGHDVVLFGADAEQLLDGMVATNVSMRYQGRDNVETFLKEVRFMGQEQYVCTGSDEGDIFVWETHSGRLAHRLAGDTLIVNGVEPHPWLPTLATCGIDPTVKIFDFAGGGGMAEMDPIKAEMEQHSLFFSLRQQTLTRPPPILGDEIRVRMEGADQMRAAGNEAFRRHAYDQAISCYKRALTHLNYCPPLPRQRDERDSVRLLVHLNLAASHLKRQEFTQAEKYAARALRIDPTNVKGLYRYAKALAGNGDTDNAIEVLERALELPNLSDAEENALRETHQTLRG